MGGARAVGPGAARHGGRRALGARGGARLDRLLEPADGRALGEPRRVAATGIAAGAVACMAKPFEIAELRALVRTLIAGPRTPRAARLAELPDADLARISALTSPELDELPFGSSASTETAASSSSTTTRRRRRDWRARRSSGGRSPRWRRVRRCSGSPESSPTGHAPARSIACCASCSRRTARCRSLGTAALRCRAQQHLDLRVASRALGRRPARRHE